MTNVDKIISKYKMSFVYNKKVQTEISVKSGEPTTINSLDLPFTLTLLLIFGECNKTHLI